MKTFKVYSRKVFNENKEDKNYNVDHTSLVFLINKDNEFIDILNTSLSEKQSAKEVLMKILRNREEIQ